MTTKARCREHWRKLGIKNEETLKGYIETIFEKYDHQADLLIELYRMILPGWDSIERIDRHPVAGKDLWRFICSQFIEFERKYHPGVFKGGIWLDMGFSSNIEMAPWEGSFENCVIVMN